jgi:hypothetical protein
MIGKHARFGQGPFLQSRLSLQQEALDNEDSPRFVDREAAKGTL